MKVYYSQDFAQETLKRLLPGQGFLKRGYPLDKSQWIEISPVDTVICLLNNWGQVVVFFSCKHRLVAYLPSSRVVKNYCT